jgi:hypothetical protein
MSVRIVFCAVLAAIASTLATAGPAMSANDSSPNAVPAQPQIGRDIQPAAPACRQPKAPSQAKARSANRPQLTAEERAQRKALRAQRAAQGGAPVAKPRAARLPLC